MRVNRLLYPLIEKEFRALYALGRIEQLFSYKRDVESAFAKYVGTPLCTFVDSGTTALYLACRLVGIGVGDDVILPVLSWPSTIAAILACGALPRFVDIKDDCTIDEQQVTITEKTRCIIPVHMYGHAAALDVLIKKGVSVIEDCCQAHGTRVGSVMVGSFGTYGAFSFDPFKTIASVGTGGALVYKHKEDRERIHSMLSIEQAHPSVLQCNRTPGKMSYGDMATLHVKVKVASLIEKRKHECRTRYEAHLAQTPITLIRDPPGTQSIRQSYLVYAPRRDELMASLAKEGIICKEPYLPLHRIPLFSSYTASQQFPQAERYTREALILPLYPLMDTKDVDVVCNAIINFYSSSS
ncbi:DegT/DnrJ/EryC1/StrS family aminotransferase [Candidatus Woesearchaeota archaeon]|nr:DegT/DnrJ/EryC1/StrS family aminotransferase [Candidatus Woesearchaeota archaeon]